MLYTLAPLAFAAAVAALPQAASSGECSENYPGTFQIQVVNQTTPTKRMAFEKRQSAPLTLTLADGILKDSQGRIGNIVANEQFQFDPAPGQPDAIYTSGWSVCNNGSLSIGGDSTFYQCLSGTFYNLYDEATAAQCSPVYIQAINGGGSASQVPDGQVTATQVASQMPDGQITAVPVSQISDGQIQQQTGVQQISDGQIQNPVSQISDGQIQAPVSTTGSPVQQISDGQIQATATGAAVSQIGDGQVQVNNGTQPAKTPSATYSAPAEYTGAASQFGSGLFGIAAGAVAIAML